MARSMIACATVMALSAAGATGQTGASLLVAGGEGDHIVRYGLDDGKVIDHFVADGVSSLDFPFAMAIGPD